MATQAEVDLVINANRALPQVTRDLNRIVTTAENGAPDVDLNAALNTQQSLRAVQADLNRVIATADANSDDINLTAVLNQARTLADLDRQLTGVIRSAQTGANQDPIQLRGVLDGARTLVAVRGELDRVITTAQRTSPPIRLQGEVDWDRDRLRSATRSITDDLGRVLRTASSVFRGAAGAIVPLGVGIAGVGAAAGTATPLLAGLVGAVESVIPASAVATQGLLAMQLVTGTVKLGMMGLEEAIENAFDPDVKPEDLAESLDKLAPSARKFVLELAGMKDELKDLQLGVQDRLFKGLDGTLRDLSRSALPQVRGALNDTAVALNKAGRGAADAAVELAENGTLGRALDGATKGLNNLVKVPAQATTAFGQLAAAAAPAFDRITKALGSAATRWSKQLDQAFESGRLEKSIDEAVDSLAQLGRVAGNVFGIIKNVANAATTQGEGLFGTLEKITQALEDVTASREFQTLIGELVKTMSVAADQAFPLFTTALSIVSQLMQELAPVVREVLNVLGPTLLKVLDSAEGPILSLGNAVGLAAIAMLPLVEVAGDLIADLLPSLTPLFETLGVIIQEATPFIRDLADNLSTQLTPILQELPGILEEVLPPFEQLAREVFPVLSDLLTELSPYVADLAQELADLAVELAPVIADFIEFSTVLLGKIIPIVGPLLTGLLLALTISLTGLTRALDFLLPGIKAVGQALTGDFRGALKTAGADSEQMKSAVSRAFNTMAGDAIASVTRMAGSVATESAKAGARLLLGVSQGVDKVKTLLSNLPSIARGAVSGLAGALFASGAALINGLIRGISSKIGEVRSKLGELTSLIPDWKGPMERDRTLLTKNGQAIMDSLMDGFDSRLPEIKAQLGGITAVIPQSVGVPRLNMAPRIQVSIGGEAVDQYVTYRVRQENDRESRVAAQGVRR